MAIFYRKPKPKRDWSKFGNHVSLAALEGVTLNIPNVIRELDGAATKTLDDPSTDERAWIWIYTTLCTALHMMYRDLDPDRKIDEKTARKEIKKFANLTLQFSESIELKAVDLNNPIESKAIRNIKDSIVNIFYDFFDKKISHEKIVSIFSIKLRSASARVFALDPKFYIPIQQSVENLSLIHI